MNPLIATIGHDTLNKVLATAMAHGADFAEIFAERTSSQVLQLENQKIRQAQALHVCGVGIRVIHHGQVGYAISEDLSPAALHQVAATASLIAHESNSQSFAPLAARPQGHPDRYPVTQALHTLPTTDKIALLMQGDAAARAYSPDVQQVLGGLVDSCRDIMIANSEGLLTDDRQVMARLAYSVVAKRQAEVHTGFAGGGGRVGIDHFTTASPQSMGQEASRMALAQMGAKAAPAGAQTVVLSPGWSGILLHEAIGHGLEADFIAKRSSLYTDQLGEQVAGSGCTVIDSGTIQNGRGSLNIDDEGVVPEETILIENGILKGYLTCRLSAAALQLKCTGNGRRESYRYAPMPRMTNTYMAAGPYNHEEIIASVDQGLYCAAFGGGQVDITNGNFVFEVCEGYRIEKGKLTYPVRNAMIIGIGPQALKKVSMVGNDPALDPGIGTCGKDGQTVPVGVGLPTIRMDDIVVGGTDVT